MRYIGNKAKLLNEIDNLLQEKNLKKQGLIFCDAFSGTATVSNNYNGFFKIIANDFLDYAYEYCAGILLYNNSNFKNLGFDPFEFFKNADTQSYTKGFCFNNFSPNGNSMYFSDENAKYIDFIRDTIDIWYENSKISKNEKSYLLLCLLEAVSKVANVAGVYSACLKIWDPRAIKRLNFVPVETKKTKFKNEVFCSDILDLISKISGDILYIDPPYTPTQYNSQYHTLETIIRNDNPKTHGIGKHRNNDRMSKWCKKSFVEFEFAKLIKNANFKHIVFSYSDKGIMSLKFIEAVLKRYAKPGTFTFKKINFYKYKSTRAVNKENAENTKHKKHFEYLFYIEKTDEPKFQSPLNYIGGKFSTLELLKNNLPKKIDTFYDLFGGGANVAININAKNIIYNDINFFVVSLLKFLANNEPTKIYQEITKNIKKYKLEKENKEAYVNLRNDYNKTKNEILLYLLICYGFEHQIRFNSKHEFNNPCGNSGFSDEMYEKLISFYLRCNEINIEFLCGNYENFKVNKKDFIYLDPPYFGNNGAYQDGKRGFNGWDLNQEQNLRNFIENLDKNGVKFMFSNYIEHTNGNQNLLQKWVNRNNFKMIIDENLTKRNRQNRREIIIINYGEKNADKS